MGLTTYRKKRDFARTDEPRGGARAKKAHKRHDDALSFVVQKHDARNLHYDFRLELDGVLLSWAIPKGPSLDPSVKRLAMQTEDHPLEYGGFEGVIPAGEYGGGPVIVWDRGRWIPEGDPRKAYAAGRLTFELEGQKLQGGWHLVRTGGREPQRKSSWLLFKRNDAAAARGSGSAVVDDAPASVLSGRTIEQVSVAPERTWRSNRAPKEKTRTARKAARVDEAAVRRNAKRVGAPLPVLRSVTLTHPERVLYPEQGITKAQLALYYAQIAERMLPHLRDRPLMLVRCPEGTSGACFHQKHPKESTSPAIHRVRIAEKSHGTREYMTVDDVEGLVALVQVGALEIHTWGSRAAQLEYPDQLTFDLDPDEGIAWARVVEAAQELRARLTALELPSFVKTTGGKGLHVVVPIAPRTPWDDAKIFSKTFAEAWAREEPARFVTEVSKAKRRGKILLDYLRNSRGATAVCAYSTRARSGAPVATPITWEELDSVDPQMFTVASVPKRVAAQRRDPWHGMFDDAPSLPSLAPRRSAKRSAA